MENKLQQQVAMMQSRGAVQWSTAGRQYDGVHQGGSTMVYMHLELPACANDACELNAVALNKHLEEMFFFLFMKTKQLMVCINVHVLYTSCIHVGAALAVSVLTMSLTDPCPFVCYQHIIMITCMSLGSPP